MTTDAGERLPDIENGVAWTSTLKPSHRRSSHRPKHRSKPAEPTTPTSPAAGTSGSPSPRCGGQRRSKGGSLSRWRPHRASASPQRRCTGTRAPVRPQRGSRRTTNAQECECFPAGSSAKRPWGGSQSTLNDPTENRRPDEDTMADDELAIVIAREHEDWPGGRPTLTARTPRRSPTARSGSGPNSIPPATGTDSGSRRTRFRRSPAGARRDPAPATGSSTGA